jgi:hypothetical protein
MDGKDWLPIFFERSNAMGALWNIEILIVLGLIAFLGGGGAKLDHRPVKVAIVLAFLVGAGFNLQALMQVTRQRAISPTSSARSTAPASSPVSLRPPASPRRCRFPRSAWWSRAI